MSLEVPSEVSAALANYAHTLRRAEISAIVPHAGFSGAGVWKVVAPAQTWALRRWPQPGLPPIRIRGLHRLLEHLHRQGLSFVSVPVSSDAGETLLNSGGRWWQLEPWLPGAADFHNQPNPRRLQAAMTALARWHRGAATFQPDAETQNWFGSTCSAPSPAVSERLARLRLWTPPSIRELRERLRQSAPDELRSLGTDLYDRFHQVQPAVTSELAALRDERFALQPCLRDIWHDHVLFTGDDVTGLIDASACRQENIATDLARLIGSLAEDDAERWRIALEAYRTLRPLSLAEEALVVVLDRSGVLLSAATWLEWLFIERRNFPDPASVRNRLHQLRRRLTAITTHSGAG